MQRNTLFGGLALLLAGGAIGAGAMVSSNAMAAGDGAAPPSQLTMVRVGDDGEAVKCTFVGADVDAMLPDVPAGVPAGVGGPVLVTGAAGDGPHLVVSGGVQTGGDSSPKFDPPVPPDGAPIIMSSVGPGGAPPVGAGIMVTASPGAAPSVFSSTDDARDGTPEECAAMHDEAVKMATTAPPGGGVVSTNEAVEP